MCYHQTSILIFLSVLSLNHAFHSFLRQIRKVGRTKEERKVVWGWGDQAKKGGLDGSNEGKKVRKTKGRKECWKDQGKASEKVGIKKGGAPGRVLRVSSVIKL